MIHAFQNAVSYLCFAVLAVIACLCVSVGFRQVRRWLRTDLCPVPLLVFATAAAIATSEAQKRGGEGGSGASAQPIVQSIPGAVTNAKWRAHGAFEDAFYIRATNWWARMPGGGWIDRLRVRSSGSFQARVESGGLWTNYPPSFAQKLSLAPEAKWPLLDDHGSFFWHATTPSNTLVISWIGGLYARSHTNLVDFQAEIFNDGSFAYRYADRTEHFAASLPFDLDGDGLENAVDPEPLVASPDAHGTNAEWYNTVCSNVLVASTELSWCAGVNSNAYYFVDVVTERGPAPIYFIGDRETRLGNPVVVARAFETNRVPLLIGVDYSVTSDTPFTVSFPVDYMYPEVETNNPCRAHICWPPEGYFIYTSTNDFLRSHTRAALAGIWNTVASDNSLGSAIDKDLAGYRGSMPRRTLDGHETTDQTVGWCDGGSLTWKIPFGWNKEPHAQDADPVGRFAEGTRQIFRISAGGDFRMEKLGHYAERKLDGRIFVDGRADDGILDNN